MNTRRQRRRTRKSRQRKHGGAQYYHYSRKPISELRDIPPHKVGSYGMKPNGFWISEERAWKEWCNSSGCMNLSKFYIYKVQLDISKLYVVDSLESLNALQSKYFDEDLFSIDWNRVAETYAGILFTNYDAVKKELGDFQPEYTWFMVIDINSACIWRPSAAIQSFLEA